MHDTTYQPGDICRYSEEHAQYNVCIIKNLSTPEEIAYEVEVLRVLSPPARGLTPHKVGATFSCSRARKSNFFMGIPELERIVKHTETPEREGTSK